MKRQDILPELNGKKYISDLNKEYEIRFLKIDEINLLIEFLKKYWRADHIFTYSRDLLDWQHLDKKNNRYNFVIAMHKKTGEIHSILGFVPISQFDESRDIDIIWPCIWKSRDDINVKGLGVSLYYYLKETLPIRTIAILGISKVALSIYKHWNFTTGKISHYFYPNDMINNYSILAGYKHKKLVVEKMPSDYQLRECKKEEFYALDKDDDLFQVITKHKSKDYYINRFINHPIYQYTMLKIEKNQNINAIMVLRESTFGDAKCIRIVDYIGNISCIQNVSYEISSYIEKNGYEYMDFIEVGLDDDILERTGFINRNLYPEIIVPNYFEPFMQKNIDLDFAYKTVDENEEILFFKADADQDRPNYVMLTS